MKPILLTSILSLIVALGIIFSFRKKILSLKKNVQSLQRDNFDLHKTTQVEANNLKTRYSRALDDEKIKLKDLEKNMKIVRHETGKRIKQFREDSEIWKASLKEKSAGFPTLLKAIEQYEAIRDEFAANLLRQKKNPALKAAEQVKEAKSEKRKAEFENKKTQSIIEYYEDIAPFLIEYKNEIIDDESWTNENLRDYSEEEKSDKATNFLTKQEYRSLPDSEKNQLALDRYWKKNKSKREIGRLYECYVGYLYELKGYEVEYFGSIKGLEDLGRDLICKKNKEVIIIQCKNWSSFKTIHEKHIFQFFGTVFQYKMDNPNTSVKGEFYTSTELSSVARSFAKEFKIEVFEKHRLERYPCIKGNISRRNYEKIYHLPFDQQYDKIKMELNKGEQFFDTVENAEKEGFRRAKKWRSGNDICKGGYKG